ncbi:MAG: neutral/alkaline non-lysosomal ceramidase N-terminal domain-containing protein [Candidatus Latescibacterota bacterium]
MSAELRAGTACVDITPPLTIPYLGYVPRQSYFTGVHDPLHARALVVQGQGEPVALIAADAIGFSSRVLGPGRHLRGELGEAIQRRCGIPSSRVMLAASHAHSTPETLDITPLYEVEGAVAWAEGVCRRMAEAVAQARAGLQVARLKFGSAVVPGIALNRREQLDADGMERSAGAGQPPAARPGRLDEEVGVLLVELSDRSFSLVANFACHPVSVQVQPLVSADYPGVACRLVEQAVPECRHCLFTQGADGDINPQGGGGRASFDDVGRYGQILGGAVLQIAGRLRAPEVPAMAPSADVAEEVIALPIRSLPDPEPYRQAAAAARAEAEAAGDDVARFAAHNRARLAAEVLRALELGSAPLRLPVQVLRLGDVALVGCPGEVFASLGLEIKQQAAAPHALVVGYANDYAGYLYPPIAATEGGYETSLGPWSRVAPEGGRMVVDAGLRLVHRLWRG